MTDYPQKKKKNDQRKNDSLGRRIALWGGGLAYVAVAPSLFLNIGNANVDMVSQEDLYRLALILSVPLSLVPLLFVIAISRLSPSPSSNGFIGMGLLSIVAGGLSVFMFSHVGWLYLIGGLILLVGGDLLSAMEEATAAIEAALGM